MSVIGRCRCRGRYRLQQRIHERHIDHGSFIDDQQVALERVFLIAREPSVLRAHFEEPMDRFASIPVCSVIRFAARPVGAARATRTRFATRMRRIEFKRTGLANAGAAGDNRELGREHEPHRLALRQRKAVLPRPALNRGKCLCNLDAGPWRRSSGGRTASLSAMACSAE